METITDLKLIVLIGDFPSNIAVDINKDTLELKINKNSLFQTLKDRKTIVGFINKKLDSLVEEHIGSMAENEITREKDL